MPDSCMPSQGRAEITSHSFSALEVAPQKATLREVRPWARSFRRNSRCTIRETHRSTGAPTNHPSETTREYCSEHFVKNARMKSSGGTKSQVVHSSQISRD